MVTTKIETVRSCKQKILGIKDIVGGCLMFDLNKIFIS